MTSDMNPLAAAKHEASILRTQRNMALGLAIAATITLIVVCALFAPAAYQQEQQGRAESVRLTIPSK